MVDTMIRLHEDNSTDFDKIGICVLPDAISCEVVEERNGQFELEMTYSVEGRGYSELMLRRLLVVKPNPFDDPQPFRIYEMSKPINGIVTIRAEHISYDLSGYSVKPFNVTGVVLALSRLKTQSVVACPFDFTTDKSAGTSAFIVEKPSSIRSLLGGTEGSILDIYGGEYEFDRYNVKLWSARGENRGVSIRYGKNLTSLQQDENCANVYTHVYPYFYTEDTGLITLSNYVVAVPGTHNYTKILPLDLTDKFNAAPTQSELRTAAQAYISSNKLASPKVSLTVSFVQLSQSEEYKDYALLETVHLCDTVGVEFPKLGVSSQAKCIKTVYNVLTGKYKSIELGEARSNLASTVSDMQSASEEDITETSKFKAAVTHATQLITGGLGGYVVLHSSSGGETPDEILIMDKPTIESATNVWRWNKNGLGHSKTGYNGSYGLAMTYDGQIVATKITSGTLDASKITVIHLSASSIDTGTMNAARIKGGTLSLGGASNGNGIIEIFNSSNQRVGRWDNGALYIGNIISNLSSPNTKIDTAGAITAKSLTANNYVYVNGNSSSLIKIPYTDSSYYSQFDKNGLSCRGSFSGSIAVATINPGSRGFGVQVNSNTGGNYASLYVNGSEPNVFLYRSGTTMYHTHLDKNTLLFYTTQSTGGSESVVDYTYYGRTGYVVDSKYGTKSAMVRTKDYLNRLLYCYETPSPMFGDVGEGLIAEDGKSFITIDSAFAETVNLAQYQVFLQKYGAGECYVSQKNSTYFIVEGTPGLSFGWELKAKQKDHDQLRLDYFNTPIEESDLEYGGMLQTHIEELKSQREVA